MTEGDDMKPSRELSGEDLERITNAIVRGYDLKTLGRVLRFKWGVVLAEHVDVHQGFIDVVANLIEWTERSGRTLELLKLATANNRNNPRLQEAAAIFGLAVADAQRKYDESIPAERPESLEAAVNKQSRLINYAVFQARLPTLGNRICRVETPFGKGTGFLIGPDLVLTNYHVVRQVIQDKTLEARTICRFDYRGPDRDADPVGRPCNLADPGILASSRFSDSDLTGEGEPGENELDYALLRLADKVGDSAAADNEPRGWFDLSPDASVVGG